MNVQVQALTLYAISDQISRNSCSYGMLIGTQTDNLIRVKDAFELKFDNGSIDFAYTSKRLALLQTVSPSLEWVGLFTIDGRSIPDAIWSQFLQSTVPTICLTFHPEMKKILCLHSITREALPVAVVAEETEEIATSTIHSHYNYTNEEPELTQENEESLALSLQQLERKVHSILAKETYSAETERKLVHLANKLSNYQGEPSDAYQLFSSQLSLLTNQLSTVGAARELVNNLIFRYMGSVGRKHESIHGNLHDSF